jgi:hypothetical protein
MAEAPVVVNHQIKYRGVGVIDIYSIARDTWRTWRKVRRMRKAAKQ